MQQFVDSTPSFVLFFRCRTGVEHTFQRFIVKVEWLQINLCEHGYYVNLNLDVNFRRQKSGTLEQKYLFDDNPRPTCRSVYTVSDKHLRHGGSGYETMNNQLFITLNI